MQDQRVEQADEALGPRSLAAHVLTAAIAQRRPRGFGLLEQLLQQPGAVPLQGRTGGPLQGFEVPASALAAVAIDHIEELSDLGADGFLDHPQRFI